MGPPSEGFLRELNAALTSVSELHCKKKKSHTYTPIHILLMSSALLSRPLVGLASCLKAGNCFHSFFLFSVIKVDYGIYNNTTRSSIPQCLYMNVSQTVFL